MDSLVDLAASILRAVQAGNWFLVVGLVLVLAVGLLKKFSPWDWTNSDPGGVALLFLASLGGALATTAAASTAPTWALVWTAVKVAAAASGGFTVLKKFLLPLLLGASERWPALKKGVDMLIWVINTGIGTSPLQKADAVGKAAVDAAPGKGVAGVIGEPRDIP